MPGAADSRCGRVGQTLEALSAEADGCAWRRRPTRGLRRHSAAESSPWLRRQGQGQDRSSGDAWSSERAVGRGTGTREKSSGWPSWTWWPGPYIQMKGLIVARGGGWIGIFWEDLACRGGNADAATVTVGLGEKMMMMRLVCSARRARTRFCGGGNGGGGGPASRRW